MTLIIKICGLSTAETVDAAIGAGADMLGFVFFAPSPRHIALDLARELGARVESRAQKVALSVNADDAALAAMIKALSPDVLQLHGSETPQRLVDLRRRFGLPMIKAIGVSNPYDLFAIAGYAGVADCILLDAKPPADATRPGGNARSFDWSLISGSKIDMPWMLSGGLSVANVAQAIRMTQAPGVDVSSGVESAPSVKDSALITAFIANAKAAAQ